MRLASSALLLSSLFVVAACGDDEATHDAGPGDVDADPSDPDATPPEPQRILAVSGDFESTGIFSTIDTPSYTVDEDVASGVASQDPVIRVFGDTIYIVNRFGVNNVTLVDRDSLELIEQISTGADSNPQDVAVVGDKLYVAAMGTAGLVTIDLADGNALATIDLSELDETDDKPNCNSVYAVGDKVFASCGILDDEDPFLAPRGPGQVAVIDTTDDSLETSVELPGNNPFGWLQQSPELSFYEGDLLVALVPSYSDFSTGCLARVSTGDKPTATCAISNEDLAGYASHYEVSPSGTMLWLAVAGFDAEFNGYGGLKGLDLGTGDLWDGSLSPEGQVVVDLAVCGNGDIAVTDRPATGDSGIRVYSGGTTLELTEEPVSIGMPPSFVNGLHCYALPTL